jgi:hypothetical protein
MMRPSPSLMIPVSIARTWRVTMGAMRKVFDAYRRAGLKIQPSKCHLFQAEIEYLGHVISKDGISPVPKYVQVVQKWPLPTNKTKARSFLGKVGYYLGLSKPVLQLPNLGLTLWGKMKTDKSKRHLLSRRPLW